MIFDNLLRLGVKEAQDVWNYAASAAALFSLSSLANLPPRTLTLKEVHSYFSQHQFDGGIAYGILLKESTEQGLLLTFAFMDHNNDPVLKADGNPMGKALYVDVLDPDLSRLFGSNDLLVFG